MILTSTYTALRGRAGGVSNAREPDPHALRGTTLGGLQRRYSLLRVLSVAARRFEPYIRSLHTQLAVTRVALLVGSWSKAGADSLRR